MVTRARADYEIRAKDRSKDGVDSFERRLKSISKNVAAIGAVATAAAAGGILQLTSRLQNVADEVQKLSIRSGASTEFLSGVRLGLEKADVSFNDFEKSLLRLQQNASDALNGLTTPLDAFNQLGIDVESFIRLSPEQQIFRIADALSEVSNKSQQVDLSRDLLGRGGTQLLTFFADGSEGIQAMIAEAERFNLIIDQDTADAAAKANDEFTELKRTVDGLGLSVTKTFSEFKANAFDRTANRLLFIKDTFNDVLDTFKVFNVGLDGERDDIFVRGQDAVIARGKFIERQLQLQAGITPVDLRSPVIPNATSDDVLNSLLPTADELEAGFSDTEKKVIDFYSGVVDEVANFNKTQPEIELIKLGRLTDDEEILNRARRLFNGLNELQARQEAIDVLKDFTNEPLEPRSGSAQQVSASRFAFDDQSTRAQDEMNRRLVDINNTLKRIEEKSGVDLGFA